MPDVAASPAATRLGWIDAARAVSIVLIVLMHARIVLGGVGVHAEGVLWVDDVAGHLRIPVFFAAAGLLAARWARASWRELFTGRLAVLLWVFVVWQPVVLAYKVAEWWLLRDQLAERGGWQVLQMVLSPVRPVGELWFLWALAVFLVLSKLTARAPAVLRVGVPAVVSYAWIALAEPLLPIEVLEALGPGWGGVAKYYVFFVAAATFSQPIRVLFSAMPRWWAAAIFVAWFALTAVVIESGVAVPWLRFGLFALGAFAGFALGRVLEPLGAVRYLGRRTLPVYVAHLLIVVAIVLVLTGLGLPPLLDAAPHVTVVVVTALAIVGALLLHRALVRTRLGRLAYAPPTRLSGVAR